MKMAGGSDHRPFSVSKYVLFFSTFRSGFLAELYRFKAVEIDLFELFILSSKSYF